MEVKPGSVLISLVLVTLVTLAWRVLNCVWLKPKQMERCLRKQGFKGNPYKLLFGDAKEIMSMMREARSKPMDVSDDDILPRVLPHHRHCLNLHGKNYFQWFGPAPCITIIDPKLIKEIMFNHEVFRKPVGNPLLKLIISGVLSYEAEKWTKPRNHLNPAFHPDKLKKMVPAMYTSWAEMMNRWQALVSTEGSCEVDVWPHISNFAGDVISRTALKELEKLWKSMAVKPHKQ